MVGKVSDRVLLREGESLPRVGLCLPPSNEDRC